MCLAECQVWRVGQDDLIERGWALRGGKGGQLPQVRVQFGVRWWGPGSGEGAGVSEEFHTP